MTTRGAGPTTPLWRSKIARLAENPGEKRKKIRCADESRSLFRASCRQLRRQAKKRSGQKKPSSSSRRIAEKGGARTRKRHRVRKELVASEAIAENAFQKGNITMKTKHRTDVRDLPGGDRETPRTTGGRTGWRELHHPGNAASPRSENRFVVVKAGRTKHERDADDGRPVAPQRSARGGYAARDNLIITHLHLVRKVARQVRRSPQGTGARLEDLEADGKEGLVEAATRFDPTRGTRFSAFAKPRIRGAMIDGIRAQSPVGRRPYERLRALAAHSPANTNGSEWFASDLFSDAGTSDGLPEITEGGQTDARWNGRRMAQLPVAEDDRLEIVIRAEVRGLPDLERKLVGLCYHQDKRLTAAARAMGVGRSWTSRLHARTLRMLGEGLGEKAFELLRERGLVGRRRVLAAPETDAVSRPTGGGESPAPSASPGSGRGQRTNAGEASEDRNAMEADNAGGEHHEPTRGD
jgi:RNA polymerase sigma factor FliA